ncbi:hypothetical protein IJJ18_03195 [Candidatus Saccharibacteria bacterium]|nr:hypothetical protein [Candidatus Saccharibacteria bacterium]
MSKTTKIIAALGVVAGIGVASLPLASYAEGETSVSGNVRLEVEISPAIAMRIHSNADQTCTDDDSDPETPDTCTDNYGFIGYEPADAQGPSDAAAVAGPSLATGLQLSANQADESTLFSEIEVRSNTGAFKLELLDADDDTNLNLATPSATANEYIPAGVTLISGGANDGKINGQVAGWAVKGGDVTSWTAVPAGASADYDADAGTGTAAQTPLTILASGSNATSPLAYSAKTTVNYGVASGLTKTGVYSDIVTYTATAI